MSWQLLITLQTVLVGTSLVAQRVLARDKHTAEASFVIIAGVFVALYSAMLVVALSLGGIHTDVFGHYWWRFVGGGVAFAITNVCTYKTLVYFDVAVANIVGTLNAIFAVIGAALILSEDLTARQLLGGIVLLLAIAYGVLATHASSNKSVQRSARLGVMYALLAGISFAVAAVNEKSLLGHMPAATYMVYGVGWQCIMAIVLAVLLQPRKLYLLFRPRVAGWSLLSGLLRGFGGACFILAEVRSNNVGLVSVIANFRLIVAIFLGAWLLGERQYIRQKLAAAAVSIAGMGLMFWK
jgi:drug/metabolite transporter (DMT)-like permease